MLNLESLKKIHDYLSLVLVQGPAKDVAMVVAELSSLQTEIQRYIQNESREAPSE